MRHFSLPSAGHFVNHVELGSPDFLIGIQDPVGRANERLFEVDRILDDRDNGQMVPVPDETLGHRRAVAVRDAVALKPAEFQVRGRDHQRVAVPLARRKARPRVRGMPRRMRPAVEPDQASGLPERAEQFVSDDLLRDRVHFSVDTDVGGPPQRVRGWMRLGLMLAKRQDRRVPTVGLETAGVVQRNSGVVAEVGSGNAVRLVFVVERRPVARRRRVGRGRDWRRPA